MPIVWLVTSSFKPLDQFYASPPTLLPNPPSLSNLAGVLDLLQHIEQLLATHRQQIIVQWIDRHVWRQIIELRAGARIMLLHRRDDFLAPDWPFDMTEEAARLRQQVDAAIKGMARRLFTRANAETLRLTSFAILDVPFAAVHRHVAANELPPPYVDDLIAKTYQALIAPARTDDSKRGRRQDPD